MKIGIISNQRKDESLSCLRSVVEQLQGKVCQLFTLSDYTEFLGEEISGVKFVGSDAFFENIEILILIGGDGTFLRVADRAARFGIKVLGINMGTVGYMTEVECDELHQLDRLINGDYTTEDRMMISATVSRNDKEIQHFHALNDVVVTHGTVSRMINLALKVGGKEINSYRADGIILSTPTGSTAYSLSAGGPIIDPKVDAITVTPICSHSITSRPIIFDANAKVEVEVLHLNDDTVFLTADGCANFQLDTGDIVTVTKCHIPLKLIRLKNDSFYNVLHSKLK